MKICQPCREEVQKHSRFGNELSDVEAVDSDSNESILNFETTISKEKSTELLNRTLQEMGESPLNFTAFHLTEDQPTPKEK